MDLTKTPWPEIVPDTILDTQGEFTLVIEKDATSQSKETLYVLQIQKSGTGIATVYVKIGEEVDGTLRYYYSDGVQNTIPNLTPEVAWMMTIADLNKEAKTALGPSAPTVTPSGKFSERWEKMAAWSKLTIDNEGYPRVE